MPINFLALIPPEFLRGRRKLDGADGMYGDVDRVLTRRNRLLDSFKPHFT